MNLVSFSPIEKRFWKKVNYPTFFSLSNSISKLKKTRNLKFKNLVSFSQILKTNFLFYLFKKNQDLFLKINIFKID